MINNLIQYSLLFIYTEEKEDKPPDQLKLFFFPSTESDPILFLRSIYFDFLTVPPITIAALIKTTFLMMY
jgi:hypothetical protein